MSAGIDLVLRALDAAPAAVDFFIRDDDAGWDDARLFALLNCCDGVDVPIDLAVIPLACSEALAHALCARIAGERIGVHQHGFEHVNHEATGRKCEFGVARLPHMQQRDLYEGRNRLQALFGRHYEAIFTPPWNRCSTATPALLAEAGYAALSRDSTAPPQSALPELAVDVDWCKQRRLAREQGEDFAERLCAELARIIAAETRVGVMLHHAAMDTDDLAFLHRLLVATKRHPHARWCGMGELLPHRSAAPVIEGGRTSTPAPGAAASELN